MVVRSQLVPGAQERSPLIDVFASRIDRKALAYRLFHRLLVEGRYSCRLLFPSLPGFLRLFGSTGCEVVGPVAPCVFDPTDCGVQMDIEQVGKDRGRQVHGEGSQSAVAGSADGDAVAVEPSAQRAVSDRLSGNPPGEQPARISETVRDGEPRWRFVGETPKKSGEAGRQQERMFTQCKVGVLLFVDDLVCGEVPDAFAA